MVLRLDYIPYLPFSQGVKCAKDFENALNCSSVLESETEDEVEKHERKAFLSKKFKNKLLQFPILLSACCNKQDHVGQS